MKLTLPMRLLLTRLSPEVWAVLEVIEPDPYRRGVVAAQLRRLVDLGLAEHVSGQWRRSEAGTAALLQREEVRG